MAFEERRREVAASQRGLIRTSQLLAAGVSREVLGRRLQREWRLVRPHVVLTEPVELDAGRRLVAAGLYGGVDAGVTSLAAASWHGVTAAPGPARVHVEVPVPRNPRGAGFVVVRRTRRPDIRAWARSGILIASPPRAVVSAADAGNPDRCRAIVLEAVQRGVTTAAALRHELEAGPRAFSAAPRRAVDEAEAGAWSVPESDLLQLMAGSAVLPPVLANPYLAAADGRRLPRPDAWLDDVAMAVQVHSWRYHSGQADWTRTVMSDGVLTAHGITVLQVTPHAISHDPVAVLRRIEAVYRQAQARPRPAVVAVPQQPR